MRTRRAVAMACGLAVGLAAASCGRPITQPIMNSARLIGTWTSSDGATLTFRADQAVTVRNLRLPMVPGCDHVLAAGTWQFLSLQGDSPGPGQTYSKSNLISVDFSEQAVEVCSSEFTTWKDSPLTMCLDLDPDSPCSDPVFTKDAAPS